MLDYRRVVDRLGLPSLVVSPLRLLLELALVVAMLEEARPRIGLRGYVHCCACVSKFPIRVTGALCQSPIDSVRWPFLASRLHVLRAEVSKLRSYTVR